MKSQSDMDFLPLAWQVQFFCWNCNGEQKGKAQYCFYSKERFPPICCGWQGTLKRKLHPASPAVEKKRERKEARKKNNCQANRQSLPCLLRLVAAVPSQGLNHTLLNSHESPENTEMPQSDSEHCHGSAPTPQYKITALAMCAPLTAPTLTKTTSLFIPQMVGNSLQFALSNHANMSPVPMQRPARR